MERILTDPVADTSLHITLDSPDTLRRMAEILERKAKVTLPGHTIDLRISASVKFIWTPQMSTDKFFSKQTPTAAPMSPAEEAVLLGETKKIQHATA